MAYIETELIAEALEGKRDPLTLTDPSMRRAAWETAAILLSGGMDIEEAAEVGSKLRNLVDESLRKEWRREHGEK